MPRLAAKERRVLEEFKKKIQENYPEEQVYLTLFGSRARGEAAKESDMDILVVIRSEDWKLGDRIRELGYDLELRQGIVLSIQVMSQRHVEQLKEIGSQFLHEVEREGIVV
jgi:predicted nucleotidyltransferase